MPAQEHRPYPESIPRDFSLVLGGPLFQLFRRAHLIDDALKLLRRRVLALLTITWLPLLLLSTWEGGSGVPFLYDLEVQLRFLLALPLLIIAELVVHKRLRILVSQFQARQLIHEADQPRFAAAIDSAFRLRNSILAEVLLIVFVYVVGVGIVWRQYSALNTATWYATPSALGAKLLPAGIWYAYISIPIFQFLLCRWYYRIIIWIRFLWQVSRLPLNLIPTHPDRAGGLGFLSQAAETFAPLVLAHGALLSGNLANRIFFLGAALPDFKSEVALVVIFLSCVVFSPLLLFSPQLHQARLTGLNEYGVLAQRYVREFDTKWLRGGAPPEEPLVGSGDIQSLADLGNSFEVVKSMKSVPFNKESVFMLVGATVAPLVPLALTMFSLEELLKKLLGILF